VKTFVLIPGAWLGAWAWEPVASALRARGHDVYPVTLTGLHHKLDDCSHVGLTTHVNDVLSILHEQDLSEVIVVGHGTSGIIAGVVADRAADRVVHTVYVEACLPHDGQSVLEAFGDSVRAHELLVIAESGGHWPAPDAETAGEGQDLTPEQAEWLALHMVDHPGRPLTEPVTLTGPPEAGPATYVVCRLDHPSGRLADDVERLRTAPGWTFTTLETGVWPMISAPGELATLLDQIAAEDGGGPMPTLRSSLPPSPARRPGSG
jgi:pimeloyl-ACP methyl ester carboxylesterase